MKEENEYASGYLSFYPCLIWWVRHQWSEYFPYCFKPLRCSGKGRCGIYSFKIAYRFSFAENCNRIHMETISEHDETLECFEMLRFQIWENRKLARREKEHFIVSIAYVQMGVKLHSLLCSFIKSCNCQINWNWGRIYELRKHMVTLVTNRKENKKEETATGWEKEMEWERQNLEKKIIPKEGFVIRKGFQIQMQITC